MSVSRASGEPVARYSFHAASTASGRTALPADWNGQRDALRGPEFFASRSANSPEWPLAPVVSMFAMLRSEEHTSELQSHSDLVCRLLLEKKKNTKNAI